MKKIQDIIKNEIPVEFFFDWKESLQFAYNLAVAHVAQGNFEYPQAINVLPYEYNAYADQNLKQIARNYPCFEIEDAKTDQGYNFTILRTPSIILTQKAIASPNAMVEISNFRCSLARGNAIFCNDPISYLFPIDAMKFDSTKDRIYAILTHNRASVFTKGKRSFSNIAFPDPSFSIYIANINLDSYCDSINIIKPVKNTVAEICDEANPRLKITAKEEAK